MDARGPFVDGAQLDGEQLPYAALYCEENVWQLARRLDDDSAEVAVVSNPAHTVAVWAQRAAPAPDIPVVWDYHVLLWRRTSAGAFEVWDLDTTLGLPCSAELYLAGSFPLADAVKAEFQPQFRVLTAAQYLEVLVSDRAHMRAEGGEWIAPPPPWAPIGEGPSTLLRLCDMNDRQMPGEIHDLATLRVALGLAHEEGCP